MVHVPLVLVLIPSYSLRMICSFIISVQVKLIGLLTPESLCVVNVPERWYLLLLHLLRKETSRMTNFMSNPPSDIIRGHRGQNYGASQLVAGLQSSVAD